MKRPWRIAAAGIVPLLFGGFVVLSVLGSGNHRGLFGLILFLTAITILWIIVAINTEMAFEVNRRVPAKSLFESIDNRRVWREHARLFPKSKLRSTARFLLLLFVTFVLAGFILFAIGI